MTWLVTGGAGYIGSHVASVFIENGHKVVVVDNLSSGRKKFVPVGATLVEGGIEDGALLDSIFADDTFDGVVHLAGFKFAGESVTKPLVAYHTNTVGTVTLLMAMMNHGVKNLVFSSSCSVYGDTGDALVDETFPLSPASPYGRSKLAAEMIIRDTATAYSLQHTCLRYFNVIGSRLPGVYDLSPHNIVPAVHTALQNGQSPRINGDDYDTPDGTCVRDYVDVGELAVAHLKAAERLTSGLPVETVYNLGSESGASVRKIIDTALQVSAVNLPVTIGPRRAGDPASIVARSDRARRDLGWSSSTTIEETVSADWHERTRTTG